MKINTPSFLRDNIKNSLFSTILLGFCLFNQGCASDSDYPAYFNQLYKQKTPLLKTPKSLPEVSITGTSFQLPVDKPDKVRDFINSMFKQHYIPLGIYQFKEPRGLTEEMLAKMTAKKGGDYYIYITSPNGIKTGTRMVMTGMTTPSVISSTSQANAYGNYNGTYNNNYGGYGTINANANAFGSQNSQTIIGGSKTYQAQQYSWEEINIEVIVLASPKRQSQLISDGVMIATHP